ncbi:RHS repeat-associated core domain-containing protein [Pedobacter sandarakinus]|uniref:RHS repeat-associated core domain-containing protein n=1 Tax=Pedobacter sandarakinus TaxID=353156 RepID=UPI002AFE73C3|nr:RHS repeat-associated core domain-containing protein [Pedobacter sandarakinus]
MRTVFDIYNGAVRILQRDNYYAFGLRKSGLNGNGAVSLDNKYLYNGKELQEELGQYDYGARFYDPIIGRWNVIDRLSEYHFNTNPYHYVLNNPLKYIDPFGLDTVRTNQIVPPTPGVRPFDPKVDVIQLEGATVQGKSKDNTNSILSLVGATATGAENMVYNKETWYSLSQMRNYSQRYFGNQYHTAEMISKAKGLSKLTGTGLKIGGYTLGAYGFYSVNKEFLDGSLQYNGKPMSQQSLVMENISNGISTFGGTAGAGWGIGWEIGRKIASDPGYRKNVRPLLQDFLGVERDEYNQGYRIQERLENQK